MKKKIIFVDDEINIINALKRMLFPMQKEWEMHFVDSGEKALEFMANNPVDIIVTDMRMPEMDGVTLLTEVQKRHPEVIRIVLSGYSDQKDILKTVNLAHQFLSKPCSSQKLKEVINNTFEIIKILNNEDAKRKISKIDSLPSLPDTYQQINEEMNKEDCSLKKIADIIASDIGMSANILKLVNSSFFGLTNNVSSPHQAVNLLGLDILKGLLISSHLFQELKFPKLTGFSIKKLMNHSLMVGNLSKIIAVANNANKKVIDDSFIAGMLHDVGKLILLSNFTVSYQVVINEVRNENLPIVQVENSVLGISHAEIGAYLLGLWGLSESIVEAVALHHKPNFTSHDEFTPLTAIHFANSFEHELIVHNSKYASHPFDKDYMKRLKLEDKIDEWKRICEKKCKEMDYENK